MESKRNKNAERLNLPACDLQTNTLGISDINKSELENQPKSLEELSQKLETKLTEYTRLQRSVILDSLINALWETYLYR